MSDQAVVIVCTDAAHTDAPQIIDVFRKVPDRDDPALLVWAGDNSKYTHHGLATAHLASTYSARIEDLAGGGMRKYYAYRLHCSKCPRGGRSVPARRRRMFEALDLVAATGESPIELRVFGAIVSKQ